MPKDTVAVFMRRVVPANLVGPTTLRRLMRRGYRADAALQSINELRARGRTAIALRASFQFVREPVGFPVDISTAVPAILNADALSLGSMAWGTVLESAYRVGHHHFEDYTQRWHYRYWGRVMAAAGLPMNQVTAGMSEVATTAIAMRSPWAPIVASCVRGRVGRPCLNCWKCFRKTLVERAVTGQDLGDTELDALFAIPEAITNLRKVPIKHENVLAFATSRYTGNHQLMRLLRARTRGDRIPVDWMTRWYSPSIALLPGDLRNATLAAIKTQLDPMDVTDEEHVRGWNLDKELNTEQYRQAVQQLDTGLKGRSPRRT